MNYIHVVVDVFPFWGLFSHVVPLRMNFASLPFQKYKNRQHYLFVLANKLSHNFPSRKSKKKKWASSGKTYIETTVCSEAFTLH
jgi:hypothetical protein